MSTKKQSILKKHKSVLQEPKSAAFCHKNKSSNPVISELDEAISDISEAVDRLQTSGKVQSERREQNAELVARS